MNLGAETRFGLGACRDEEPRKESRDDMRAGEKRGARPHEFDEDVRERSGSRAVPRVSKLLRFDAKDLESANRWSRLFTELAE